MIKLFQKCKNGGYLKVAIGPVFDEFGGVSQHIFGIKKYSAHEVAEVPSRFIRTALAIDKSGQGGILYRKLKNKIRLRGYDVIHSHAGNPWFTNLCMASRANNCKWVNTYHTLYFEEDYPGGLNQAQEIQNGYLVNVASKADLRICISQWLHDYLLETYSIQTEVVPNGVDLENCAQADPERFRRKYKIFDEFVLFVSNVQPVKNPGFFVELAIRMPELRFVMIGRGLDEINLERAYGGSIPRNLALTGELSHRNTLDAISACKAFVMTSKREGIPTSLLEAMGMGKPVVAPNHSGCKEVIQSNDYGFLYEPDSLEDLVEQVKQALISKHVGERARERVLKNYSWKVIAKKIDSIYESLI